MRTRQVVAIALMILGAVAPNKAAAADPTRTLNGPIHRPQPVVIPVFIGGEVPTASS